MLCSPPVRQGRLDLLNAIRTGTLTVTEVYSAARTDQLATLTGERALLAANLWTASMRGRHKRSSEGDAEAVRHELRSVEADRRVEVQRHGGDLSGVDWRSLEAAWTGAPRIGTTSVVLSRVSNLHLGDVHHPVRRAVVRRSRSARSSLASPTCRPLCSGASFTRHRVRACRLRHYRCSRAARG